MKSVLVFVYGTLKEGFGNNQLLTTSRKLGNAVTVDNFILTNVGFPYMIIPDEVTGSEKPQERPVLGEVYEVTDEAVMASLDRLEGVSGGHYRHLNTQVKLGPEETVTDVVAYTPCRATEAARYSLCGVSDFYGEEVYVW